MLSKYFAWTLPDNIEPHSLWKNSFCLHIVSILFLYFNVYQVVSHDRYIFILPLLCFTIFELMTYDRYGTVKSVCCLITLTITVTASVNFVFFAFIPAFIVGKYLTRYTFWKL